MGFNIEFNWYLVDKNTRKDIFKPKRVEEENEVDGYYDDYENVPQELLVIKDGYRVYPVDAVVPLIAEDTAIALVHITALNWENKKTGIHVEKVMDLEGDIQAHYTSMYHGFKAQQQEADHGGKVNIQKFVNGMERHSFSQAVKKSDMAPSADFPGVFTEWKES